MRVGVMVMPTDRSMPPDELAVAVEERGLGSLFLPEHTHIPTSRLSPYPGGGELKEGFRRVIDPMIGLAMAAAVTEHIELGTGVMLVNQHDPITLAKQISTLDHFSGGRFVFGGGFGWNAEEMAHHGVDPKRRRSVFRDKVLAMKQLWTHDEAAYSGEYVSFSSSWQWPKPARKPHPPILLGGAAGPAFFRHIVEYADGWIPIGGSGLRKDLQTLHAAAEDAGRDPASLSINVFGAKPERGSLDFYRDLGIERVALALPPAQVFNEVREATRDEILPVLDEYAILAKDFQD
jgi:probable F420-dependent oxidoreductase